MLPTKKIPANVIPRLSRYYRALYEHSQQPWVSSSVLSEYTGFTAAQIRKDLGYFGQFGSPGKGYDVEELKNSIRQILGLDRTWNAAVIGVGNLGTALLGYRGFKDQGFNIVAAFDSDTRKIGGKIKGVNVFSLESMAGIVKEKEIQIAILTVPGAVAQQTAETACNAGIKSILNFAPVHLRLPDSVKVRHIDMSIEIERLSFLITTGD